MGATLDIARIDGPNLLSFLEAHGRSEHGVIDSQYEDELSAGSPDVGAMGMLGCGRLLGAISYGVVRLPREGISGRIDVVVTDAVCRGKGIGSILIASLLQELATAQGDALRHVSVVAMHPAIARSVAAFGFEAADVGPNVPLYQVTLDGKTRLKLIDESSKTVARTMAGLRVLCARCKSRRAAPWCKGP
jgi:GNAT superfamily N-acetyltransferase